MGASTSCQARALSVEEDLLEAVLVAPRDDDAPRLVYADCLIARGDPQGELIVAQCTRARLEAAGERASEAYRSAVRGERVLMAAHVKAWVDAYGLRRSSAAG